MEYSFTVSWQCYGINKLLISHTSSLHALYIMPVKLISGDLTLAFSRFKHCLANLSAEAAGSGSLDSLVVGVAL
jgi:hypothetical protein